MHLNFAFEYIFSNRNIYGESLVTKKLNRKLYTYAGMLTTETATTWIKRAVKLPKKFIKAKNSSGKNIYCGMECTHLESIAKDIFK